MPRFAINYCHVNTVKCVTCKRAMLRARSVKYESLSIQFGILALVRDGNTLQEYTVTHAFVRISLG